MNETERQQRLEKLITYQATWIEMLARQQGRLEMYATGRLLA